MTTPAVERVDLPVRGMTCAACARAIERTLWATEGVERASQLEWLKRRGCQEIQGYLLSMPLSAADLEAKFLRPDHDTQEYQRILSA